MGELFYTAIAGARLRLRLFTPDESPCGPCYVEDAMELRSRKKLVRYRERIQELRDGEEEDTSHFLDVLGAVVGNPFLLILERFRRWLGTPSRGK